MAERADNLVPTDGATYLQTICARHARVEGGNVIVDLPQQQLNALGAFLVQAVFGFFLALDGEQPDTGALAVAATSHPGDAEARALSSN